MNVRVYMCESCGNMLCWSRYEGLFCRHCGLIAKEPYFSGEMHIA